MLGKPQFPRHGNEAAMRKFGGVEKTGQIRLTWTVQGDKDCFKFKGLTDGELLEGCRVSDESGEH